jgi:DNA-binding beta-propeller fold protein YncE
VDARTGHAFVASPFDGTIDMLDTHTGALLRTEMLGGMPRAVAVDERLGRVFVAAGGADNVSVLDSRMGRLVRTVRVGRGPVALAVDVRANRVVVVCRGISGDTPSWFRHRPVVSAVGEVSVLDARTLSSAPRPWGPVAVAAAERTGHAIVASVGGSIAASAAWQWLPSWLRQRVPWLAQQASTHTVPGTVTMLALTP